MKDCRVWEVPHRKRQVQGVCVNYYNDMALYHVLLRQDTLSNKVNNILSWDPSETLGLNADELILIPNRMQMIFVNPAGEVRAPSHPGYLRIVKFLHNSLDTVLNSPPGFLQDLECVAKCIVSNVSAETVQTVRYKYGHKAGEVTHKVGDSAISVDLTAYYIGSIGIKAMVKRVAKQTGHTLLEDYQIINSSQKESQGGASTDEFGLTPGEKANESMDIYTKESDAFLISVTNRRHEEKTLTVAPAVLLRENSSELEEEFLEHDAELLFQHAAVHRSTCELVSK
ncbi:hypothetical protein ACRRTK_012722 [Alexandromys fortis]